MSVEIKEAKDKKKKLKEKERGLKEKLFPSNGLQERKDNFMAFYLKYGEDFIETLKAHFDPLEKSFVVIEEV